MRSQRPLRPRKRPDAHRPTFVSGLVVLTLLVGAAVSFASANAPASPSPSSSTTASSHGLAGVALNSRGQGLPGVEIRLVPLNGIVGAASVRKVFSDETGRFAITSLAPGLYRLVAVKGGYSVLVGQVNTLLQDTLKLILSPSGAPGPPGSRPADASWALRLPHRDLLEDRGFEPVRSPSGDDRIVADLLGGAASQGFTLEALASRIGDNDGSAPTAGGAGFALGGAVFTRDHGLISGRVGRLDEGGDVGLREKTSSLRLRWIPQPASGRVLAAAADLFRRETGVAVGPDREDLDLDGVHMGVSGAIEREARVTDLRFDLAAGRLSQVDGLGAPDAAKLSVVKATAAMDFQQRWAPDHELVLNLAARGISGALSDAGPGTRLALLPSDVAGASVSLTEASGSGAFLSVGDRWHVSRTVTLMSTARSDWNAGFGSGVRGAATVGAQWTPVETAMFRAESGLTLGGERAGSPVARVSVEGGGPNWNLSVARDHEVGPVVWRTPPTEATLTDPFLAGRDAATDRWTAGVHWRAGARVPEVRVQATWVRVKGAVAPRLPGDLPLVPLDSAGAAAGRRVEFGLALPRTRTEVTVFWDQLKDRSGDDRVLLEGADRWTRRAMSVRQRLVLWGRDGPNCDLVIGAEENRLTSDAPAAAGDSLRQALLQRRRYTGGVALSF